MAFFKKTPYRLVVGRFRKPQESNRQRWVFSTRSAPEVTTTDMKTTTTQLLAIASQAYRRDRDVSFKSVDRHLFGLWTSQDEISLSSPTS